MTTGWSLLMRADLRRDRWMLLWWIAGIVLLYWSQAVGTDATYPTQADLASAAKAMTDNPALVAMTGPARALDTIGGQVAWQASAFGAIAMGLMNMFLVGRHTRAEEESGRDELVRSAAVGRAAPLVAALVVVLLADVVAASLTAVALVAYGLPVEGSLVLAAGLLGCGLGFAGVALVAVQLFVGTRPAYGLTGVVVAAAYVLRAVGDVGGSWLSWCSPIGWAQAMWPYSGDRWWPGLLFVPSALALIAAAVVLFSRRDVGSGLWAARPGPARGRLGMLGLVWRLQRGSVVGWSLGTAAMGLAYGSLGDSVGDVVGDGRLADDVLGLSGGDVVR
ncbi:MAG: ABC transporter permease, partial [Actinomycetales bacterium]